MTDLPPPAAHVVAAAVRRARQAFGLTQIETAAILGISQPALSAVETGRAWPTAAALHTLHVRLSETGAAPDVAAVLLDAAAHVPPVRTRAFPRAVKVAVALPPKAPRTAEMIKALSRLSPSETWALDDEAMGQFVRAYFECSLDIG